MSLPIWPTDLPRRVLQEGFNQGFGDGRLSTKMEAGPPKTRRRFSTVGRPVQAGFNLSNDQRARLERFWFEETAGGSVPFLMRDQLTDGGLLLTDARALTDENDRPLLIESWWLVLFGETPPSVRPLSGTIYRAEFSLTILP